MVRWAHGRTAGRFPAAAEAGDDCELPVDFNTACLTFGQESWGRGCVHMEAGPSRLTVTPGVRVVLFCLIGWASRGAPETELKAAARKVMAYNVACMMAVKILNSGKLDRRPCGRPER